MQIMQGLQGSILVVDDNPVIRQIMKLALEQNNHHVTLASDGQEAIELMHIHFFDLILLDIMMPKMTGFEVLEYMAKEPELAKIPVIVVSADSQLDNAIRCIQLGAEDYLVKPPNHTLLNTRVDTSLRRKFLHDQEQAHQAEIEQMYEAVKEANMAKTEFIGMAAHELRNPIAQISTTSYLLSRLGPLNDKQMQLLDKISFSLERMQALIVDLDDISRLETGNIRLNLGTLDLRELIGKIVESFEHDLMVENHELNIRMPDDLPPIWADRGRMIQVLTNLLRNALKYTPDGGEISLTAVHNQTDQMQTILPTLAAENVDWQAAMSVINNVDGSGLMLTGLEQMGNRLVLQGRAVNDAFVISYAQQLEDSGQFAGVTIQSITQGTDPFLSSTPTPLLPTATATPTP